jgi:hypothetical protein
MGKLHEILAVEGDLDGTFKKLQEETKKIFGKPNYFVGFHKQCKMFTEGDIAPPDEFQEITTTVQAKLDYLSIAGVKYFDAVFQKDVTNSIAKADIILPDGTTLLSDMPATFLLGLENKLRKLRDVYDALPTLQQGVKWEEQAGLGKGVYQAVNPDKKVKTAKQFKHQVLYEATDKHPAQIEKWEEQVPVGEYITTVVSGMITPARKAELLGRLDELIQATKKARQRANTATLETSKVGSVIFEHLTK